MDLVHRLDAGEQAVDDRERGRHVELVALERALEVDAAHELHDEDRLGPRARVERDEPGEVRVRGQHEQRAGLLAEQRLELLLGQVPRRRAAVVRNLERDELAIRATPLLGSHPEKHRSARALADRAHDVVAAEQARQRDPAGQHRIEQRRRGAVDLGVRAPRQPHQHALDRGGDRGRQRAAAGVDRDRDRGFELRARRGLPLLAAASAFGMSRAHPSSSLEPSSPGQAEPARAP